MGRKNRAASLVEIGMEGFATLEREEYCGPTTRPPPPPRPERQQPQANRIQQPFWSNRRSNLPLVSNNIDIPTKENEAIDCNQAARKYGGVLIKDAGKRKSLFGVLRG